MKKQLLSFAILLLLITQTKAQNGYHKFLDNTSWYEGRYYYGGFSFWWYYKSNDTLINALNYTIIRSSSSTDELYLREDTVGKKVYLIYDLMNQEVVLYDFSLSIGADFPVPGGTQTMTIHTIDSVLTPLGYRKRFFVYSNGYPRVQYIEGVGSLEQPMTFIYNYSDPIYALVCSYRGILQSYFRGAQDDTCPANIYTGIITKELPESNLDFYPNPATNQLTIHPVGWSSNGVNASSFHNEVVMVSVMNVLGQTSPPTPLHVERGDATIDVSSLSAGIYFLQVKSKSGSVVKKFVKE